MARPTAEWSNRLSIFWIKKNGYLNTKYNYQSGGIKWTYGTNERGSSIGFAVNSDEKNAKDKKFIRLNYTHTDSYTEDKENMDYKIELTTTTCHFGGKRYWFICPLVRNGKWCGRRVGVIYSIGKYFGCRHCGNIAYTSQNANKRFRRFSATLPDIEKLEKQVKLKFYNGKPTKKYLKLIKMNNNLRFAFINYSNYLTIKRNKIDGKGKI